MYYSEGYDYVVSYILMNSNFDMIENVRLYLVWKQDPRISTYTLSCTRVFYLFIFLESNLKKIKR